MELVSRKVYRRFGALSFVKSTPSFVCHFNPVFWKTSFTHLFLVCQIVRQPLHCNPMIPSVFTRLLLPSLVD